MKALGRQCAHTGSLTHDAIRIRSGDSSARIVQKNEHASIGEAGDGSLWILVHDTERRPRGRDPGIMIDADRISFEQNGLVRVLDRRTSQDTISRLVADLTGRHSELAETACSRSGIPAGDYAGIVVEPLDGQHYRVQTEGPAARRFEQMQSLGKHRWLVLAGEESLLRRELVRQLMPVGHRLAWALVRQAVPILLSITLLLTAMAFWNAAALSLSIVTLGLLLAVRWRRQSLISWARERWVQPCVDQTLHGP